MESVDKICLEWHPEYSAYDVTQENAACVLSLRSPAVSSGHRAPVSLTLVLDRSGSMSGAKLDLVKTTITFLIRRLDARDSVGIIAYDDTVKTIFPLTQASEGAKERLIAAMSAIHSGRQTNLSGGLFKGLQEQLQHSAPPSTPGAAARHVASTMDSSCVDLARASADDTNGRGTSTVVKSVFLFTDGHANVGQTRTSMIIATMRSMLSGGSSRGSGEDARASVVTVSTFGFGNDHDPDMLQSIATEGSGMYYYITSPETIPASFADALGGLLSVVAQNVEITITPRDGATLTRVLTAFQQRTQDTAVVVTVPNVFAEESKDILVMFGLPEAAAGTAARVADVRGSYLDMVAGGLGTVAAALALPRVADPPRGSDAARNEHVLLQRTRLETADGLQESVALADAGRLVEAWAILDDQRSYLGSLSLNLAPENAAQIALLSADIEAASLGLESEHTYDSFGKKLSVSSISRHTMQRSNGPRMATAPRERSAAQTRLQTDPTPMLLLGQANEYSNSVQRRLTCEASSV